MLRPIEHTYLNCVLHRDNLTGTLKDGAVHVEKYQSHSRQHPEMETVYAHAKERGFAPELKQDAIELYLRGVRVATAVTTARKERIIVEKFIVHESGAQDEKLAETNLDKIAGFIGHFFGDPACRP